MSRRALLFVTLAALTGCRSPTQISVTLETDVPCAQVTETSFTAGELGALESAPPTTEGTSCNNGTLGTVVLVPSGADDATVAFKVVTALNGQTVDTCSGAAGASDPNCIVARRALRYVPHTPLDVIVAMTQACEGEICGADTTCVNGACASATIPDPTECEGEGCNATVLAPGDGGVDATLAPEGGDASSGPDSAADSASGDSSVPVDAAAFDGAVPGCDLGGLQPGSPWPMSGYCPNLRSRSPLAGPATPPVQQWAVALNGSGYLSPSIGADGTVYIDAVGLELEDGGVSGGSLTAIAPDGGIRWVYAPDGGALLGQLPVLASDSTLRLFNYSAGTYDVLTLDGSVKTLAPTIPSRGGVTITSGGTVYASDTFGNFDAYEPNGTLLWSVPSVASDYTSSSVGANGVIFFNDTYTLTTGLYPDGGKAWQRALDAGPGTPSLGPTVLAPDGTLRVFDGNGDLWSLDAQSGGDNWHHNFAAAGSINGIAIADDGTTYLGTAGGMVAVTAAGVQLATIAGVVGAPIVDVNGDVYATCGDANLCSFDHALSTQRWKVSIPNDAEYDYGVQPILGFGGTIYIVTTISQGNGALHAFAPAP
jgi:hypothetical protein